MSQGVHTNGLLEGIRVVEIASEAAAFAGKIMADLGAEVILVEPPGGHVTRTYEPFLDDIPGPERSLFFWHYNTSKRSVVIDLTVEAGRAFFEELVATADVVLDAEPPYRLASLGIDQVAMRAKYPRLVWTSVTPFGSSGPRSTDIATDLTLMASGGIAWNCGYDDHSLPPVAGSGHQAFHTGSLYAVMSTLTALVYRDVSGAGQFVDVNINAAVNVTTEAGSYEWLIAQSTVQRQTCRHAAVRPSTASLATAADGKIVHTGVPPRFRREFEALVAWMEDLGLQADYDEFFFLEMGVERGGVQLWELAGNAEAQAIFGAGREGLRFMAERLDAQQFFLQGQSRGLSVGMLNAPEDVMADPHFAARGFHVSVEHPELGRSFTYPGLPFRGTSAGGEIRRAPLLGDGM
jgi:crotonobetainyl-CoA:carnitine CoA-transferase CaiB-like acyl-CoA transferase